jgi:hypothetical protein
MLATEIVTDAAGGEIVAGNWQKFLYERICTWNILHPNISSYIDRKNNKWQLHLTTRERGAFSVVVVDGGVREHAMGSISPAEFMVEI